jgi:hypothetical protein
VASTTNNPDKNTGVSRFQQGPITTALQLGPLAPLVFLSLEFFPGGIETLHAIAALCIEWGKKGWCQPPPAVPIAVITEPNRHN